MPAHSPAEIHALFRDAFNLGDIDALAALYEPGAILVLGSGENVCGRENIRRTFEDMLQRRARMTLETRTAIESNELAMLHAAWVVEPVEGNGSGPITQGLSTELVRKQPDGSWLFVIDSPYT